MAKFVSTTPPSEPVHTFEFSQREIDLMVSLLHDLTVDHAGIYQPSESSVFFPNARTSVDLRNLLDVLKEVDMSVKNDYLSNFYPADETDGVDL